MEKENLQNEALRLEKLFQYAISGDYSHEKYTSISEIVYFIKSRTENLQQLSSDKAIFIIGPTGAGKSTLMNYLSKEDNLIVSKFDKLCARDSIADIGEGTTGSTTLFPNTWKHDDIEGVFIDCAGDFDTRGVLIEVINSKVKTLIANNVKSAKILLVIPQTSLSAEGAYGKLLKDAVEINAKFINDINYFRDNIVLVISHASRYIDTHENIDTLLYNVMERSSLSHYTDTVKHVIEQKNMVTFCKPSDEASPGSSHEPPAWNMDERKQIIQKVSALNFIEIPRKDFFNVSSSLEVKEKINKALTIVKKEAVQILTDAVKEAITPKLNIYATELKYFADFLKQLVTKKISCGLEQYIRYLKYNNFLTVSLDPGVICKLTDELLYLESFTNDQQNSNGEKGGRYDWNNLSGIPYLLRDIHEEVSVIINKSSEIFTQFGSYNNLIVNGSFADSVSVKCLFKELEDKHAEKCNVESLRYYNNSKYYYGNQVQDINSMKNKSDTNIETYSEFGNYKRTNSYSKDVPYTVIKNITEEKPATARPELQRYHTNSKYYNDNQVRELDPMENKSGTKTKTYSEFENYKRTNSYSKEAPYTVIKNITEEEPATARRQLRRNHTNSKYYNDNQVREFDPMENESGTKTETYSDSENYKRINSYSKDVPYIVIKNITEEEPATARRELQRCHTHSKYYNDNQVQEFDPMENKSGTKTETYSEFENYKRTNRYSKDAPYTVIKNIAKKEPAQTRSLFSLTLGLGTTCKEKLFKGISGVYNTIKGEANVSKHKKVPENMEETDYKDVSQTKVARNNRNEPVFENSVEFNESEYNTDIKKIDDSADNLSNKIMKILAEMKLINQIKEIELSEDVLNRVKMNTSKNQEHTQDQCSNYFTDLYEEWKFLEYQGLFLKKPDMSTDINNMKELLD